MTDSDSQQELRQHACFGPDAGRRPSGFGHPLPPAGAVWPDERLGPRSGDGGESAEAPQWIGPGATALVGDAPVRVYLPATSNSLRSGVDAGDFGNNVLAYAVTAELREWYVDDDVEELEYAASGQAVRASLRMVDADPLALRRRVVLSFDVTDSAVTVRDDLDRGAVRVAQGLFLSALVAVHIDDEDAEATVGRAAAVVLEADLGSLGAQDVVDDAEGFELSWYAPEELAALLATLDIAR